MGSEGGDRHFLHGTEVAMVATPEQMQVSSRSSSAVLSMPASAVAALLVVILLLRRHRIQRRRRVIHGTETSKVVCKKNLRSKPSKKKEQIRLATAAPRGRNRETNKQVADTERTAKQSQPTQRKGKMRAPNLASAVKNSTFESPNAAHEKHQRFPKTGPKGKYHELNTKPDLQEEHTSTLEHSVASQSAQPNPSIAASDSRSRSGRGNG